MPINVIVTSASSSIPIFSMVSRPTLITTDVKRRPKMNVNYEIFARLTIDFHGSAITSAFSTMTGVSFRAVG